MKSFIPILSLAGLAVAAKPPCKSAPLITKTETNTVTVTVQPSQSSRAQNGEKDWGYVTRTTEITVTSTVTASSPVLTLTKELTSTLEVTISPSPYYPTANSSMPMASGTGTGNIPSGTAPYPSDSAPYPSGTAPYSSGTSPQPSGTAPYSSGTALYPSGTAPAYSFTKAYSAIKPEDAMNPTASAPAYSFTEKYETIMPTEPASSSVAPSSAQEEVPEATPAPKPENDKTIRSTASWYQADESDLSGLMCSFDGGYVLDAGMFGVALSDKNWDGSSHCGQCISVTGPEGNSIKAMVVDQCPGCADKHLDLFRNGFAGLADLETGIIDVSYSFVPCDISSPLILKNKEGTSQYWFSMQVMNSNVAVSKLEVSTDGGNTWEATERKEYNYFEKEDGFRTEVVDVKVTSMSGEEIVVKEVSVQALKQTPADGNFSA